MQTLYSFTSKWGHKIVDVMFLLYIAFTAVEFIGKPYVESLFSQSDLSPPPPPPPPGWSDWGHKNSRFGPFALYLIINPFTALACIERE